MTTDRELLELAARAAGIEIDKSPCNGGGRGNTGFDVMGNAVLDWHEMTRWNPLTDDGDALRLSVKLGINLEIGEVGFGDVQAGKRDDWACEWLNGDDPYAATRRAIVRDAAEIVKKVDAQPESAG